MANKFGLPYLTLDEYTSLGGFGVVLFSYAADTNYTPKCESFSFGFFRAIYVDEYESGSYKQYRYNILYNGKVLTTTTIRSDVKLKKVYVMDGSVSGFSSGYIIKSFNSTTDNFNSTYPVYSGVDIYVPPDINPDKDPNVPTCPDCNNPLNPDDGCDTEDCEKNPEFDPDPNKTPPVIRDIKDVTTYQNSNLGLQFYAYSQSSTIKEFYYSLSNGVYYSKIKPNFIGGSAYLQTLYFDKLAEYDCKIKVVDATGLSSESNTFKITVLPPLTPPKPTPIPPNVSNTDYIILYDKNANEFESNGLGILKDCIDCVCDSESNGIYELEMSYPVNTKFDDYLLECEHIIKCNVDNFSNSQLFRIYESNYIMEKNIITVKARHITYDLKGDFLEGISLPPTTCQSATQTLISSAVGNANNIFAVTSNITTTKPFTVAKCNILEALIGVDNSIYDTYGNTNTNIIRDNFTFKIDDTETDRGVVIAYKKNLLGFTRKINIEDVVTKIYPYAVLSYGTVITLKEKFISSSRSNLYVTEKIEPKEFTDISNTEELREVAEKYFIENEVDIPSINYDINFVSLYLSNKEMAKKFEMLVLNDIVTVQDARIGLSVKAKVIKVKYDVLRKRYIKVELGNFKNEFRKNKKKESINLKKVIREVVR